MTIITLETNNSVLYKISRKLIYVFTLLYVTKHIIGVTSCYIIRVYDGGSAQFSILATSDTPAGSNSFADFCKFYGATLIQFACVPEPYPERFPHAVW